MPPVLRAPGIVGALPNSADGCGYVLTINGSATRTRQDYLGVLQDYEDDFLWSSFLGSPDVHHVNADGVTGGCGNGNFCPNRPVSRDQMAVFLVRTFDL